MINIEADLFVLRTLGVVGLCLWGFVGWTTLRHLANANGHRPLITGLLVMSLLSFGVTFGLAWTMFHASKVPNNVALWSLYSNRVLVLLESAVVYWTGQRIMK